MNTLEKRHNELLEKYYSEKDFVMLAQTYCHEGMYLDKIDAYYVAGICSHECTGATRIEAIQNLADWMIGTKGAC